MNQNGGDDGTNETDQAQDTIRDGTDRRRNEYPNGRDRQPDTNEGGHHSAHSADLLCALPSWHTTMCTERRDDAPGLVALRRAFRNSPAAGVADEPMEDPCGDHPAVVGRRADVVDWGDLAGEGLGGGVGGLGGGRAALERGLRR